MHIGFYAPLKAPDHPVPSGDRQMARNLVAALGAAGHKVELISRLRSFAPQPDAPPLEELRRTAATELDHLTAAWVDPVRRPELLFTYHLYYKAPDLLGPSLARRFGLPYATAEATLSGRRSTGPWGERQTIVAEAVGAAALNICFTARDRDGLAAVAPPGSLLDLPPFIDATAFAPAQRRPGGPVRLVTVAMMRPGDKLDSYRVLAAALDRITPLDWNLTIVGDGPAYAEVAAALAKWPAARIHWAGAVPADAVVEHLHAADVMVWPGLGEAFGVCYLEAEACGVPVVAVRNAGTPSVVVHEETGLLTASDPADYAVALARLIGDPALRARLGATAVAIVRQRHSREAAIRVLAPALAGLSPRP